MRIATYNVEWFISLFDHRGRILDDSGSSARFGLSRHEQLQALGRVFRALDADGVMIIEAPDHDPLRHPTPVMLEAFADRFQLRARRGLIGYANDTQQEIAFLYDPKGWRCSMTRKAVFPVTGARPASIPRCRSI